MIQPPEIDVLSDASSIFLEHGDESYQIARIRNSISEASVGSLEDDAPDLSGIIQSSPNHRTLKNDNIDSDSGNFKLLEQRLDEISEKYSKIQIQHEKTIEEAETIRKIEDEKQKRSKGYGFKSIRAGLSRKDFKETLLHSPFKEKGIRSFEQISVENKSKVTDCDEKEELLSGDESLNGDNSLLSEIDGENIDRPLSPPPKLLPKKSVINIIDNNLGTQSGFFMNVGSFLDFSLSSASFDASESLDDIDLTGNQWTIESIQSERLIESKFGWNRKIDEEEATPSISTTSSKTSSRRPKPRNTVRKTAMIVPNTSKKSPVTTQEEFLHSAPMLEELPDFIQRIKKLKIDALHSQPRHLSPMKELRPYTPFKILKSDTSNIPHVSSRSQLSSASQAIDLDSRMGYREQKGQVEQSEFDRSRKQSVESLNSLNSLESDDRLNDDEEVDIMDKIQTYYNGLIYKDPSKKPTWTGSYDQTNTSKNGPSTQNLHSYLNPMLGSQRELKAGRMMNFYRPWSSTRYDPMAEMAKLISAGESRSSTASDQDIGLRSPMKTKALRTNGSSPTQVSGSLESRTQRKSIGKVHNLSPKYEVSFGMRSPKRFGSLDSIHSSSHGNTKRPSEKQPNKSSQTRQKLDPLELSSESVHSSDSSDFRFRYVDYSNSSANNTRLSSSASSISSFNRKLPSLLINLVPESSS